MSRRVIYFKVPHQDNYLMEIVGELYLFKT